MTCCVKIYTEGGTVWCCPREAGVSGYCEVHKPQSLYHIRYTWPDDYYTPGGKIRWCAGSSLTKSPDRAVVYTFDEADDIIRNKCKDARLIWGIVTTKETI